MDLFVHVERMDGSDWMKHVKYFDLESRVPVGSPNNTWDEVLRMDLRSKVLHKKVAHNH